MAYLLQQYPRKSLAWPIAATAAASRIVYRLSRVPRHAPLPRERAVAVIVFMHMQLSGKQLLSASRPKHTSQHTCFLCRIRLLLATRASVVDMQRRG